MISPTHRRGRHPSSAPAVAHPGFVLVGVVMFVLALTILGLSLFGLSSFEAQFLRSANDGAVAFHAAAGGMERAKFVLTAKDSLPPVKNWLPSDVAYAVAVQDPGGASDSLGKVNWTSGKPVLIRVLAAHRDARCMLQAQFAPQKPESLYMRLITSRDGAHVKLDDLYNCPGNRNTHTFLNGDAWQQSSDQTWDGLAQVDPDPGWSRTVTQRSVVLPDLSSFFAKHVPGALPSPIPSGGTYTLTAGSGPVRYYWSGGDDPQNPDYSVFEPNNPPIIDITGAGTVVWMADHGFRFAYRLQVVGLPTDCLVLVCRRNNHPATTEPQVGPWFFGGLNSPVVPVILVSDDEVRLEHFEYCYSPSQISYLSIFARYAWIAGPTDDASNPTMRLYHSQNAPEDAPNGLIDRLCDQGALPNCGAQLMTIKGTWQELDPDNPPLIP